MYLLAEEAKQQYCFRNVMDKCKADQCMAWQYMENKRTVERQFSAEDLKTVPIIPVRTPLSEYYYWKEISRTECENNPTYFKIVMQNNYGWCSLLRPTRRFSFTVQKSNSDIYYNINGSIVG